MHGVTCVYVTGDGQTSINLLSFPYFIQDMTPFFNYSHSIITSNGRIIGFSNDETQSREIVINVAKESCSEAEFLQAKEQLFCIFEQDVLAQTPGTLVVNGYSLKCYIVSEDVNGRYDIASQSTFNVVWDGHRNWTKDGTPRTITLNPASQGTILVRNDLTYPVHFKMELLGAWETPAFDIDSKSYQLTEDIENGKSVLIDSIEKTVTCSGDNWFQYLDRSQAPFDPLLPGVHVVSPVGNQGTFILTLVDERKCPPWN